MGAERVGKAVATAKRYYRCRFHPDHCPGTNANRSYQIKEFRIKKNPVHLTLSWQFHLQKAAHTIAPSARIVFHVNILKSTSGPFD